MVVPVAVKALASVWALGAAVERLQGLAAAAAAGAGGAELSRSIRRIPGML